MLPPIVFTNAKNAFKNEVLCEDGLTVFPTYNPFHTFSI